MAKPSTYLVPIDFSRCSEKALDFALGLAHANSGRIIALHVIPAAMAYPQSRGGFDFYGLLRREAQENYSRLAKRKRLKPQECRFVLAPGTDFAGVIVQQARRLRASMIVMGSHGRTGLQRLLLGSVAERTLRYAKCPVLIVKK